MLFIISPYYSFSGCNIYSDSPFFIFGKNDLYLLFLEDYVLIFANFIHIFEEQSFGFIDFFYCLLI